MSEHPSQVTVNGRDYRWPAAPTVVICLDGSEPGYIETAIDKGLAPNLARLMREGANLTALSVIPSFTNPNNLSIVTGRPPSVHGIAGNYFLDPATGEEVMMNDARFLRADTIMKAFADAGARVAVVTAKDKLRALLAKGLDFASGRAVAFSAEKADAATRAANGLDDALAFVGQPLPAVYSAALSEFVFAAGVKLLASFRPDVMYLSTTDYVQHKAAPGSQAADAFYAMVDRYVGALDAAGAVVVLTADHGMNDKHLRRRLARRALSPGRRRQRSSAPARRASSCRSPTLTSPITARSAPSPRSICRPTPTARRVVAALAAEPGVEAAMERAEACARFELPPDRVGDIVVLSGRHKVLGTTAARHDLSGLAEPLRSHGGLWEQRVPMIVNRRLAGPTPEPLRNFDAFDVALNRIAR